ncbi:MAG: hypothetical protein A2X40_03645 [Elusimicrobia bacterium GWC2_65_9]|nr:MAG: hypothetical protein A2X40_03645 [Elusimicrobia bacterium GWC2_65_9]
MSLGDRPNPLQNFRVTHSDWADEFQNLRMSLGDRPNPLQNFGMIHRDWTDEFQNLRMSLGDRSEPVQDFRVSLGDGSKPFEDFRVVFYQLPKYFRLRSASGGILVMDWRYNTAGCRGEWPSD